MSPSDAEFAGIWFQEEPAFSVSLGWRERGENELGPTLADEYLQAAFWPFLSSRGGADLRSDGLLACEPRKPYGVLIEGRASIASTDPEKCQPIDVQYSLAVRLCRDLEGKHLLPAAPTIVAIWPRAGNAAPVKVERSWTAQGELAVRLNPPEIKAGGSRAWRESFERYEPRDLSFVDPPASPRRLRWFCRSTTTHPSVEGTFYAGVWLAHDEPCFARVTAEITARARVRAMGIPWRSKTAACPREYSFALQLQ
jgi:hypothetical protein